MPTGPNISEIARQLAQKVGISEEQSRAFLQAQAEMAYEHAHDGYFIAGIGLLMISERPERKMIMQFGAKKGQEVTLPAKNVLKFRITKAAKDVVFGAPGKPPSVFDLETYPEEWLKGDE